MKRSDGLVAGFLVYALLLATLIFFAVLDRHAQVHAVRGKPVTSVAIPAALSQDAPGGVPFCAVPPNVPIFVIPAPAPQEDGEETGPAPGSDIA